VHLHDAWCLSAPDAINLLENVSFFPLRPQLQAALYRALALVPGIRSEGRARILGGRSGIALGARDTGGAVEDEIVIDPLSGLVLGFRTVSLGPRADGLPLGAVRGQIVVVERRITHTARPR